MEVKIKQLTDNKEVLNRCRLTVWKEELNKEPSVDFMNSIYMCEHSPIRDKWFSIEIRNIPYYISTHFVRHSIGYMPYVSTQRSDRIDYEGSRDDRKQGELVNMDITLNAQAFINVSKVRLCGQADIKAQELWNLVLLELRKLDKPLWNHCVPTCIYRGFCPELKCCGRTNSNTYKEWRKEYIEGFNVIE